MARPRLLIATRSTHKLRELRELLHLEHGELVSLDELGVPGDPVEDGETFETNAALKARFGARASGLPTLADDSGIEVDALDGNPGVRTRRYAGEDATDDDNNRKLLAALRRAAGRTAGCPLRLRAGAGAPRRPRPARRPAGHAGARHVPRPDRDGAARDGRVRLRPHLRAGERAAGRPDPRAVDPGREARDLAPARPRRGG